MQAFILKYLFPWGQIVASVSQLHPFFSSMSPTSPKTESPGKRAKWFQGAVTPPLSTLTPRARSSNPLTSSNYLYQVECQLHVHNRCGLSRISNQFPLIGHLANVMYVTLWPKLTCNIQKAASLSAYLPGIRCTSLLQGGALHANMMYPRVLTAQKACLTKTMHAV